MSNVASSIHSYYDAIVIGAGHNGLTCGCYLAEIRSQSTCNKLSTKFKKRDHKTSSIFTTRFRKPANKYKIWNTFVWCNDSLSVIFYETNSRIVKL